ncbi:hypothetical protein CCAX7_008050 [Capsulimonas corticalis]|uniref:Uncharacterized protein n=1 Tax=Capsulimonas corticalis TaxID=2219043 RepID=A0A402CTS2_9BACT|nr:hypothetical protein CCAX7_008050 [Capsulimonas corticalis]
MSPIFPCQCLQPRIPNPMPANITIREPNSTTLGRTPMDVSPNDVVTIHAKTRNMYVMKQVSEIIAERTWLGGSDIGGSFVDGGGQTALGSLISLRLNINHDADNNPRHENDNGDHQD